MNEFDPDWQWDPFIEVTKAVVFVAAIVILAVYWWVR